MKICVTSTGPTMDASVDQRFGRCQYFVFVDPETMEHEAMPNTGIGASSGAGIQAAQTIADKGVDVVITGQVGPNAIETLGATNISIVTGATGTVSDAIGQYKSKGLQAVPPAPGAPAPGMPGAGMGRGMGRGGGRGGGRGMGGGMGRGMGMGTGGPIAPPLPVSPLPAQTIDEEIQVLESQIINIKAKLEELKK